MRPRSRAFIPFAVLAVSLTPWILKAHSPYYPAVVFFYSEFPDRPISEFAKGRLGIIQPTWYRGYLVVAYRYLTEQPLTLPEQKSFLEFKDLHPRSALAPRPVDSWKFNTWEEGPPQQWIKARAKFRKDAPPPSVDWWRYTSGERCLDDSFRTAVRTLQDRVELYGAHSQEVQDWITAQDQVYLNCRSRFANDKAPDIIPVEPLPTASPLSRADRAYQIAAAYFYAGKMDEAIHRFEAISHDSSSPWRDFGAYLVARMVLRQAVSDDEMSFDPRRLAEADARLRTASAEITNPGLQRSIAGLQQFIAIRLHPEKEYRLIAARLSQGGSGARFGQDIADLGFLTERAIGNTPDFPGVDGWSKEYRSKVEHWRNQRYAEIHEQRTTSDLTDWLLTFQWRTPAAKSHATERWRATKSLPWLIAALAMARGDDAVTPQLIEASARVAPGSAAYPTAALHRARLLRERGDFASARRVLDAALRHSGSFPTSAKNLLTAERLWVAESATKFVNFLVQRPIGFDNGSVAKGESEYCEASYRFSSSMACEEGTLDTGKTGLLPQLDNQAARLLNQAATLDLLASVVHSESLPENIRKQLAPAVWARAAVLDRPEEAASVADAASLLRPELKPFLEHYEKAKTAGERKFLAAYAVAHFPGLRPGVTSTPRITRFCHRRS